MNILICPDSFKGTFSALEAAEIISAELKNKNSVIKTKTEIKTEIQPMADGGEGTLAVLENAVRGKKITMNVNGPLAEKTKVKASFLFLTDGTAIIEMAQAAGLTLIADRKKLNPMNASTYGVGELINEAVSLGAKKIILFIGGSATNDGGFGMLKALGAEFYDEKGNVVYADNESFSMVCLTKTKTIGLTDINSKLKKIKIIIASDVKNLLCGNNGSAFTYSEQKGAAKSQLPVIDSHLKNFAGMLQQYSKNNSKDLLKVEGMGAAGGISLPLVALFNAEIVSGIEMMIQLTKLDEKVKQADLIITGEGRVDSQTMHGKVISGILNTAKKHKKKVIIVAGSLGHGYEELYKYGVSQIIDTTDGKSLSWDYIKKNSKKLLKESVSRIAIS